MAGLATRTSGVPLRSLGIDAVSIRNCAPAWKFEPLTESVNWSPWVTLTVPPVLTTGLAQPDTSFENCTDSPAPL